MPVSPAAVRALRELTGAGMRDCKTALEQANGYFVKARENLRQGHAAATPTPPTAKPASSTGQPSCPMVTLSERATQRLEEIQVEWRDSNPLRVTRRGNTWSLWFDRRDEGDQIVQSGDAEVLLVGPNVAELLQDATIDCEDTSSGSCLTISGPSLTPTQLNLRPDFSFRLGRAVGEVLRGFTGRG